MKNYDAGFSQIPNPSEQQLPFHTFSKCNSYADFTRIVETRLNSIPHNPEIFQLLMQCFDEKRIDIVALLTTYNADRQSRKNNKTSHIQEDLGIIIRAVFGRGEQESKDANLDRMEKAFQTTLFSNVLKHIIEMKTSTGNKAEMIRLLRRILGFADTQADVIQELLIVKALYQFAAERDAYVELNS